MKLFDTVLVALAATALAMQPLGAEPVPHKPDVFEVPVPAAVPKDNRDDALAEVNAKRATKGLPGYVRDENLTIAARAAAKFRADNLIFGHVTDTNLGDFRFLPRGVPIEGVVGGCAAYPPHMGWLSCAIWEPNKRGGAAWAPGRDGKRYMHLFIR